MRTTWYPISRAWLRPKTNFPMSTFPLTPLLLRSLRLLCRRRKRLPLNQPHPPSRQGRSFGSPTRRSSLGTSLMIISPEKVKNADPTPEPTPFQERRLPKDAFVLSSPNQRLLPALHLQRLLPVLRPHRLLPALLLRPLRRQQQTLSSLPPRHFWALKRHALNQCNSTTPRTFL